MASLAARDQENLVNAHRTAAASKPLNQGLQALQPKTPGPKAFKMPHGGRLRDENAITTKAGGNEAKNVVLLKTEGKVKQQTVQATPGLARNPLAQKTTNLKTPGPALAQKQNVSIIPRSGNRSPNLRKTKPKSEESSKLRIRADDASDDVPEIEYMPPRGVPLPDIDDDFPFVDMSQFDDYKPSRHFSDIAHYYYHSPITKDGLSRVQVAAREQEETDRVNELRAEAEIIRNNEAAQLTCACEPECEGDCKEWAEQARRADEKYKKAVAGLLLPEERREKERKEREQERKERAQERKTKVESRHNRAPSRAGPSDAASRRAASALSIRDDSEASSSGAVAGAAGGGLVRSKSRNYPKPWLSGSKAAPASAVPAPEGYAVRHAAGVAASKTNLGFNKGRTASANLRGTVLPGSGVSDTVKPRKTKTQTQILQEMWDQLEKREDEELGIDREAGRKAIMEEASQDFELTLDL